MNLKSKLYSIRMRPQESVSKFISSMKNLRILLSSLKYDISNKDFIDVILSSLHVGFKHCRIVINMSKDKNTLSIDELEAILVDEEGGQHPQHNEKNEHAFVSRLRERDRHYGTRSIRGGQHHQHQ